MTPDHLLISLMAGEMDSQCPSDDVIEHLRCAAVTGLLSTTVTANYSRFARVGNQIESACVTSALLLNRCGFEQG